MPDLTRAFEYLIETESLKQPHGLPPGSFPGGIDADFTAGTWANYDWPSVGGRVGDIGVDAGASEKPTWAALLKASETAATADSLREKQDELKKECRRRITLTYKASDLEDEILLRLRNDGTAAQDTERDRLRGVHANLKTPLATMTLPQLQAFDPTTDSHWAPPS